MLAITTVHETRTVKTEKLADGSVVEDGDHRHEGRR